MKHSVQIINLSYIFVVSFSVSIFQIQQSRKSLNSVFEKPFTISILTCEFIKDEWKILRKELTIHMKNCWSSRACGESDESPGHNLYLCNYNYSLVVDCLRR